jgi:hydroxymethylpyrimidine pyrophosphatase-like HAD family hydrolase
MNNYLVIFSAHVDSENKKNETIETLKQLKESNIDVCLSTHSNLYLDELAQYVKYVIYDDNNEFLILQDYIDNCKYLDNGSSF